MTTRQSEVQIRKLQDRRGALGYSQRPWVVRWRVGNSRFQRSYRTRPEADLLRSELLLAQRNGEAFDAATGEPSSWRAASEILVHGWVRRWLAEQWDEWQPRTRRGTVEEMSRFVPLLVKPTAPEPAADLRIYLKAALRPEAEQDQRIERWLDRWCYPLDQLNRSILADVDRQLGLGVHGNVLSPTTALRYRKAARACIRRAVDLDLIERDPWPPPMRGAKNRKVRKQTNGVVDIRRLPDPATMQQALDAMINHHPTSRCYHVMTSVMAHAGLRPSEVVMLRPRALMLPESGWGAINVTEADIDFDESGDPKTGPRTVPIPADLVALLQEWLDSHAFAPEELLFRTRNGKRPQESSWRRAWHLALSKVGHEPLRPYDCRHYAATTWLDAGVPLAEAARRLGHSVETLVSTYVGALKGDEKTSNLRIDDYRQRAAQTQAQ
jgi:integrase